MPGLIKTFNSIDGAAPSKAAQELPAWSQSYTQQKNGTLFVPWDEVSENIRKRHLEQSILRHTVVQRPFKIGKPLQFQKPQ